MPNAAADVGGRRQLSWRHARPILAGLLGASIGAAYAHFIGCKTGTCPLTSSVWTASLYGLGVGALVGWPDRRARGSRPR